MHDLLLPLRRGKPAASAGNRRCPGRPEQGRAARLGLLEALAGGPFLGARGPLLREKTSWRSFLGKDARSPSGGLLPLVAR